MATASSHRVNHHLRLIFTIRLLNGDPSLDDDGKGGSPSMSLWTMRWGQLGLAKSLGTIVQQRAVQRVVRQRSVRQTWQ